jgi:hypothetical protein
LLSNIFKDIENPQPLSSRRIAIKVFRTYHVRGKSVAMLSKPIQNALPIAGLLQSVIHKIFNEHLVGLTVLLASCVIALLIFSALVNQWSKTKLRILEGRSQHFEWLYPIRPLEQEYYRH